MANYHGAEAQRTADVNAFEQSASPYGCVQMAGNTFEWVADWFDAFYY